jgi:hypothetical protein
MPEETFGCGGANKIGTYEGREILYDDNTQFLVQVAKGKKASYRTLHTVVGDFDEALHLYATIDLAVGTKKRLLMPTSHVPVIAKAA